MKKSTILILLLVLCLCCVILPAGGFALFGYFTLNGQCSYKGPLAPKDACTSSVTINTNTNTNSTQPQPVTNNNQNNTQNNNGNNSSANLKTFSNSTFSFSYPQDWFLKDNSTSSVATVDLYIKDPSTLSANETNDNMSVEDFGDVGFSMDAQQCDDYAKSIVDNQTSYQINLDSSKVVNLSSYQACEVKFSGNYSGVDLTQVHYLIDLDQADGTNHGYFITITVIKGSNNLQPMLDVANTVKINQQ